MEARWRGSNGAAGATCTRAVGDCAPGCGSAWLPGSFVMASNKQLMGMGVAGLCHGANGPIGEQDRQPDAQYMGHVD